MSELVLDGSKPKEALRGLIAAMIPPDAVRVDNVRVEGGALKYDVHFNLEGLRTKQIRSLRAI